MAIDLSGLRRGSVWRVRTSYKDGVLIAYGDSRFVVYYDGASEDGDDYKASGISVGGRWYVEQILHELKSVADITAADLDGMVIETEDGGKVLFADGHARMTTNCGFLLGTWGGSESPAWVNGGNFAKEVAAYAAELERRKNPPVEIVWQDVLRIGDDVAQAHCTVRGDVWRISRLERSDYRLHRGLEFLAMRRDVEHAEQYIRDHYKDRAAESA